MREIPIEFQMFCMIVTVLGGIFGLGVSFKKVIDYFRSKTTVAKLTERVEKHDIFLDRDNERLRILEEQMKRSIEDRADIHENERLLLVAVQAILSGDPTEEKDARKQIQTHLSKQI